MTNTAPAIAPDDTEAAPGSLQAPSKHRITARVKTAIDAMIWQGLKRAEAAQLAGLKEHSLYVALTHRHVKTYLNEQMQVLRDSERPRNIHRAIAIRDAADNMPAMHAIKWLEGEQDQSVSGSRGHTAQSPGVTFVIVQQGAAAPMRDVTPADDRVITRHSGDDE